MFEIAFSKMWSLGRVQEPAGEQAEQNGEGNVLKAAQIARLLGDFLVFVFYPGAAITVGLSALLIMTFALRHMLSGEALSDLLTLISAHCPSPNLCMKSIFELKKHFHNLKAPMRFHKYCSHCFLQIEGNLIVCPNSFCSRDLTRSENTSFFHRNTNCVSN